MSKSLDPDPVGAPICIGASSFRKTWTAFGRKYHQKQSIKYKTRRRAPGITTLHQSGFTRCSTILSRANKAPHSRICSLEYIRPDCESPARPDTFRKCRTICNLTTGQKYVKSRQKLFWGAFHTPCGCCAKHRKAAKNALNWVLFVFQEMRRGQGKKGDSDTLSSRPNVGKSSISLFCAPKSGYEMAVGGYGDDNSLVRPA